MHLSTFSSIYSKYENAHFREKAAAAHENPFYFIFFCGGISTLTVTIGDARIVRLGGDTCKVASQAVLQIFNRLLHDRCAVRTALL